jgi:hypothetical protein
MHAQLFRTMSSEPDPLGSVQCLLPATWQRVRSAETFALDVHQILRQTRQAIEHSQELIRRSDAATLSFVTEPAGASGNGHAHPSDCGVSDGSGRMN